MAIKSINPSLINSWGFCPVAFQREKIEGQWVPYSLIVKISNGVHRGMDLNNKSKIMSKKNEPLDVITDAARDKYVDQLQEDTFFPPDELPSAKKQIAAGIDQTVTLAKKAFSSLVKKITPEASEVMLEVVSQFTLFGEPLPIRGKIDTIAEGKGPGKWALDYKVSGRAKAQSWADSDPQMTIYNELMNAAYGEYPEKLSFEVFTNTADPKYKPLTTYRKPEIDLKVLFKRIQIMLDMIEAGIFPPPPAGFWKCSFRYCNWFWTCPHIPKHRKILPKRSR